MQLPFGIATLAVAMATTLGLAADSLAPAALRQQPAARQHSLLPDAAAGFAGAMATAASKPAPKPNPRLKLSIVSPRYDPLLPYGLMFGSGWPLVIRAVGPTDALGIATNATPVLFPGIHQTGYLVLQDPDGCLELPPPFFRGGSPCSTDPSDETYVEFTNDIDIAGVVDESGNPDRMLALADPLLSGGPVFTGDGDAGSGQLEPVDVTVGPDTGGSASDGVGFGADDDFPGLVLLSATGPGLVLNRDFTRPPLLQQRNLAGMVNAVGYELRDAGGATSFTLSLVVPHGLVAPIMKIDDCVGAVDGTNCADPSIYSIDGAVPVPASGLTTAQFLYPQLLNAAPYYELRAFLVSGIAPSVLADRDGDDRISAEDARRAGYNVISNEGIVRVRQYTTDLCSGAPLVNVFYADFDGNGRDTGSFVCPAGPGQITKPPQ